MAQLQSTGITGSLTVTTGSATEFQVLNTGVRIGSVISDAHTVTGSIDITGSLNVLGIVTMSASPSGDGNVLLVRNNNPSGNTNSVIALDTIASGGVGDIRLGSANPTGIRIYASEVGLTASPSGSGFQFFKNTHPTFPGTVFFDSGANNNAAIIFRTAITAGTITERMRIASGGNVGIGTTSPTLALLQVQGTISATGAVTSSGTFNSTGGGFVTSGGNVGVGALTPLARIHISASAASLLRVDGTTSTVLLVSGSGNVGIGTLTPTVARLQVQGNVSASSYTGSLLGTASRADNATSASFASTAVSSSFSSTAVSSSFATNAVSASFATQANTAFTASTADSFTVRGTLTAQTIVAQTITSSTDFVTGSTRFGSLMSNTHQFTGSVFITGSLNVVGTGITGSLLGTASRADNTTSASFASTAVSSSFATNAVSASFASTIPGGTANYVPLWSATGVLTDSVLFQSSSRIGLGVITPATTLALAGGTATIFGLSLQPSGWNNARHRFTVPVSGDTSVWSFNWDGSAADSALYAVASISVTQGAILFNTTGSANAPTERMRINSVGFVGIGTNNPASMLHVNGNATIGYSTATAAPSNGLLVNGSVGIGTTAPALRLDIVDNGAKTAGIDEAIIRIRSTDQFGASIHMSGSSNWRIISTGTSSTPGGNDLGFYSDSSTSYRMVIQGSDGNVGIGTTSPESLLHIAQSNAGGKVTLYVDNIAASTLNNEAAIKFSVDAGATVSGGGAEISTINVNAGNGNADLTFKTFQSGPGLTEKVRITNGGNVGIGTTAPSLSGGSTSRMIEISGITNPGIAFGSTNTKWFIYNSDAARSFALFDNNATVDRLVVSASGNIGIGTSAPLLARLQVQGNVSASSYTGSLLGTASFATSASWAPGGSATLSGGSTNYVARWASSTTLTTGSLFDNGTNVGIGTTAPNDLLHVVGTGPKIRLQTNANTNYTELLFLSGSATAADIWVNAGGQTDYAGANSLNIATAQAAPISFRTSGLGNERMRIAADGNVGIGTTSPNYPIDLQRTTSPLTLNLKLDKSSTTNDYAEIAFQLWNGAGSGANTFGGAGNSRPSVVLRALNEDGNSAAGAFIVGTFTGGATNSTLTEKFRISSGGNVGIGTNNPGSRLTVFGDIATNTRVASDTINGYTGGSTPLTIQTGGSQNLILGTNNTTRVLIDTNGSVGIGTTSPYSVLDIQSRNVSWGESITIFPSSVGYGTIAFRLTGSGMSSTTGTWAIGKQSSTDGQTTTEYFQILRNGLTGGPFYRVDALQVWDPAGNSSFGFNVGIGTTTVSYPLHVRRAAIYHVTAEQSSTNTGDANAYATFYVVNNATSSGTIRGYFGGGGSGVGNTSMRDHVYVGAQSNHGMRLFTNDLARMTINPSGNVGIGSLTPSALLDVGGGTGNPFSTQFRAVIRGTSTRTLYLDSDSGGASMWWGSGTTPQFAIDSANGGGAAFWTHAGGTWSSRMTITSGGDVGVGTTDPSAGGTVTSKFTINTADASTALAIINGGSRRLALNPIASGGWTLFDGGGGSWNSGITQINSNVGINTTAPTHRLQVSNTPNTGSNPQLSLWNPTAGTHQVAGIRFHTPAWDVQLRTVESRDWLQLTNDVGAVQHSWHATRFYPGSTSNNGANTGYISGNGTNIGIGTTAPVGILNIVSSDPRGVVFGTTTGSIGTLQLTTSSPGSPVSGRLIFGTDGTGWQLRIAQNNAGTITDLVTVLTGGNVGIGTTSPTARLTVAGQGTGTGLIGNAGFTSNYTGISLNGTLDTTNYNILSSPTEQTLYINRPSGNSIRFREANGGDQMIIATGGAVGIGTTAPINQLHIQGTGDSSGRILRITSTGPSGSINIAHSGNGGIIGYANVGATGNLFYVTTGAGTIGSGITMNNNGSVGLGATNQTEKLVIHSGNIKFFSLQNVADEYRYIGSEYDAGNGNNRAEIRFAIDGSDTNTRLTFHTANGVGTINERMRITSVGNVGIGTTNPLTRLHVSGGNSTLHGVIVGDDVTYGSPYKTVAFGNTGDGNNRILGSTTSADGLYFMAATGRGFTFRANGGTTNHVTIDSSGNVGIGTTAPLAQLHVESTTAHTTAPTLFLKQFDGVSQVYGQIASGDQYHGLIMRGIPSAATTYGVTAGDQMSFYEYGGDFRFYLKNNLSGGTLTLQGRLNAGTWTVTGDVIAYGSPSDISLKTNIKPLENSLDKLMKLQGVSFTWKDDTEANQMTGIKDDLGFIAQEVQEVLPELVRKNDNGLLSLRDKGIIPLLVESIKELKAEIEELKRNK